MQNQNRKFEPKPKFTFKVFPKDYQKSIKTKIKMLVNFLFKIKNSFIKAKCKRKHNVFKIQDFYKLLMS